MIIDEPGRGIFKIDRRAFTSEDVLSAERQSVFDASWLYAAHISELPAPGNFIARKVGGRPIIVVRGKDGVVRAFRNACSHRGVILCREAAGKTGKFTCFYHSWSFSNQGDLIGLPEPEAYAAGFDRSRMGLKSVRMETYRGLIFVTYNAEQSDLETYLGDARPYIDLMLDFGESDIEMAAGAQAYGMRANWKLLVENSMDVSHGHSVHNRFFTQYLADVGVAPETWAVWTKTRISRGVSLGNGHALAETPLRSGGMAKTAADQLARIREGLVRKHGEERASQIADYGRNLFIFPNLIFVSTWRTLRTFYPISPDYVEIDAWAMLPSNEDAEMKRMRLDNFISFLGPAGFGTPDDAAALESCQQGFGHAPIGEWTDASRGLGREPQGSDEAQMRAFWRRWHDCLEGKTRATAAYADPHIAMAAE